MRESKQQVSSWVGTRVAGQVFSPGVLGQCSQLVAHGGTSRDSKEVRFFKIAQHAMRCGSQLELILRRLALAPYVRVGKGWGGGVMEGVGERPRPWTPAHPSPCPLIDSNKCLNSG